MHAATHISARSADAVIDRCRQLGVSHVCLGLHDAPGFAETGIPQRDHLRALVRRLTDAGIDASLAMAWFGNDVELVLDPAAHRREVDTMRRRLDVLGDAGVRTLLHYVNPAQPKDSTDEARCWDGLLTIFRELVTQAESVDVRLANHAIWRCLPDPLREEALRQGITLADYRHYRSTGWDGPYLLTSHQHLQRLLAAVPSGHNGICFCTGMHIMGGDVPSLVETFRGKVFFSQLRDLRYRWPAAQEAFPGDGELDFARILRLLDAAGYRGMVSVEHLGKPRRPGDDLEVLAVRFLQNQLADLQREGGCSP